jgi:glycosyltransferase involved in cell wall biosynthesis
VRETLDTPTDAPVLAFVGSLTPEKRVDRFLDLIREIRVHAPSAVGWIVGDGPLRRELEQQSEATGVRAHVRFTGATDDVGSILGAAELLVLLSETEDVPAVVLEAGVVRLPVVVSRVGQVADCVKDGASGVLVDASDGSAVVQACLDLLASPERRSAMGRFAADWVGREFGIAAIADRYEAFYRQVTAVRTRQTGTDGVSVAPTLACNDFGPD